MKAKFKESQGEAIYMKWGEGWWATLSKMPRGRDILEGEATLLKMPLPSLSARVFSEKKEFTPQ